MSNKTNPFEVTPNGFWITFENGYAISVQWGKINYCDNKNKTGVHKTGTTAEVAIYEPNGSWHRFDNHDICKGWCSPEEVLELMEYCKNLPFTIIQEKPDSGTITP